MGRKRNICYITNEYKYDFKNFQTINSFGRDIYLLHYCERS